MLPRPLVRGHARNLVGLRALPLRKCLIRAVHNKDNSSEINYELQKPLDLPKSPAKSQQHKTTWQQRLDNVLMSSVTYVRKFHDITGYSEIERLKSQITETEKLTAETRQRVKGCRDNYAEAVTARTVSQREMNELLQRKSHWSTPDLNRFTQLIREDHAIEQRVESTKSASSEAESRLEDLQIALGRLIGARYREEQIWSDKIRQASTWGTWVLMGINLLLFIVVQLIFEPWKRRRLVRSFESKVKEIVDDIPAPQVQVSPSGPPEAFEPIWLKQTQNMTWANLQDRVRIVEVAAIAGFCVVSLLMSLAIR